MRNGDDVSVAVRRSSDGEIVVEELEPRDKFQRLSEIPFIRGIFNLYDMMSTGIRALNLSAEIALEEEEEDFGTTETVLTTGIAFLVAIGFFVILPVWATNNLWGLSEANPFLFNLVEGFIRIGFFLLYLAGITFFEDIKRVFQYHGAEHKSVYAYENDRDLTVDEAREYSTLHPRCGTAFLMIVLIVAILTFSLVGNPPILLKITSRLLLLPVVAGVSYEILKFSGRHADNPLLKPFLMPGLALQNITTREPSDDQLEVALQAIKHVVDADRATESLDTEQ